MKKDLNSSLIEKLAFPGFVLEVLPEKWVFLKLKSHTNYY
jgi:hypothetical protein